MEPNSPIQPSTPNNGATPPEQTPQPQTGASVSVSPVQPVQPVQPTVSYMPGSTAAPAGQSDPGKTLGMLSIALCIFTLIPITLGIIGLVKSRKAGYSGKLAMIGITLSTVLLVASVLYLVFGLWPNAKQDYCNAHQSDTSLCASSTSSSSDNQATIATGDSAHYGALIKTNSFSSASYSDLITAVSKFSQTVQNDKNPGDARQNITISSHAITILTYGVDGKYDSNGRFSEFLIPGINDPCYTDFQNNVSLRIIYDPPNGDGNLVMIEIFDKTNCSSSDQSMHGANGDIKLEDNAASVADDVPQPTKAVAEGVASQLQQVWGSTLLSN